MIDRPETDPLPIAVRGYVHVPVTGGRGEASLPLLPSGRIIVFDTESTDTPGQALRIAPYLVLDDGTVTEQGFAYDPEVIGPDELATLTRYVERHGFSLRTIDDWKHAVFLPSINELRGTCIGFNLPFDFARIATRHYAARSRTFRGGFSFAFSDDSRQPRLQVRHLNSRASLARLTVPGKQSTPRGMRRTGARVAAHRGYIVDVRTLAGALLGGSWSLARLSRHLQIAHPKLETDEHGRVLTDDYLDYAMRDVIATYECYEVLKRKYDCYGLSKTLLSTMKSEASIGKAYLRQMNVRGFRQQQPDFPPELTGIIVGTYYGGRSEVRIRRQEVRVAYCDFLSMYPTVCTLQGLWRNVIADRIEHRDATAEATAFLDRVTLDDLRRPETWRDLTTIVQIQPDGDVLPVRAKYDDGQRTIGINYLSSDQPLWFTLADVIAAKLLSGKTPRIIKAIRFEPAGVQAGLEPISIAGNPVYRIDPYKVDLYKRLIELRQEVKARLQAARAAGDPELAERLDAEQQALKICANATSYGIFMELNVERLAQPQEFACYGPSGEGFPVWLDAIEVPGAYFNPLLGTLITGGTRLMLAVAETLAAAKGIGWAFCDTDSMAFANLGDMDDAAFLVRVEEIRAYFRELNPYD